MDLVPFNIKRERRFSDLIGNTPEEMFAFYIGILLGIYLGFKITFLIWILRKKYFQRLNIPNKDSSKEQKASSIGESKSKIAAPIIKLIKNSNKKIMTDKSPDINPSLTENITQIKVIESNTPIIKTIKTNNLLSGICFNRNKRIYFIFKNVSRGAVLHFYYPVLTNKRAKPKPAKLL